MSQLSVKITAVPACPFSVLHLVDTSLRYISPQKLHSDILDLLMVNVLHESALFLRSHYYYPNQLASMIQTAPLRDWLHLAGVSPAGFPLPVPLLADHLFASVLFTDFVSMNFPLRRNIVFYSFLTDFPDRLYGYDTPGAVFFNVLDRRHFAALLLPEEVGLVVT